jgi:hypothetical protein
MDAHADTCCFGRGARILQVESSMVAEVSGFSRSLGKVKEVPIASVAVAFDCPDTYQTFILIFHQILYIKELNSNLYGRERSQ